MAEQDKDTTSTQPTEKLAGQIKEPGIEPQPAATLSRSDIDQVATRSSGWSTWFAVFALLLGILTAGGGYFLWMELSQLRTLSTTQLSSMKDDLLSTVNLQLDKAASDQKAAIAQAAVDVENTLTSTENSIAQVQGGFTELRQQLNERIGALELGLAGQQATIAQAQAELNQAIGLHRSDWAIAEIRYLLGIAADKLQFERRADVALTILQNAQQRLQDLPNPAFADVRSAIESDIAALSQINQPNLAQVSSTLQKLAATIDQLPMSGTRVALPHNAQSPDISANVDPNASLPAKAWAYASNAAEGIWQGIKSLVVIQREGSPSEPLLAPEQAFFLQQNLRLKLEAAAVAALKGESESYRRNLDAVNLWLHRFFDIDATRTQEFVQQIVPLEKIELAPKLPALSAPNAMQQAMEVVRVSNTVRPAPIPTATKAPAVDNNTTNSAEPKAIQP